MEKFYGNYRGEVIRTDDPLKAGRVKVRIFGVYDDILEEEIPWSIYADPMMGGQSNIGSAIIPNIETKVWCFFEGGDHHYPVYWAGAPAMDDPETPHLPEESRDEEVGYGDNKVFRTKSGFVFEIDDSEGDTRLRIKHPSGNEQVSDHEGNVEETINGTLTIDVAGKVNIKAPELDIGEPDAVEHSVLGEQLKAYILEHLHYYINNDLIVTANLGAPSSTVINPIQPGPAADGGPVWSKVQRNS